MFFKWTFFFRCSHQNSARISLLLCTSHILRSSYSSWFDHLTVFGEVLKPRSSSSCTFHPPPVTSFLLGSNNFLGTLLRVLRFSKRCGWGFFRDTTLRQPVRQTMQWPQDKATILYIVDRASRHKFLLITNPMHLLMYLFIHFICLHVSSIKCSSSGDRIVLIHHLVRLVCVSDCLECRSGGSLLTGIPSSHL